MRLVFLLGIFVIVNVAQADNTLNVGSMCVLPTELVQGIVDGLDTQSLINVHQTCRDLQGMSRKDLARRQIRLIVSKFEKALTPAMYDLVMGKGKSAQDNGPVLSPNQAIDSITIRNWDNMIVALNKKLADLASIADEKPFEAERPVVKERKDLYFIAKSPLEPGCSHPDVRERASREIREKGGRVSMTSKDDANIWLIASFPLSLLSSETLPELKFSSPWSESENESADSYFLRAGKRTIAVENDPYLEDLEDTPVMWNETPISGHRVKWVSQ